MANKIIKEYLNYFVESQNPNFAIMLKGKWGAGKTYFIKGIIEEWSNKQVISKDNINLNPLYISLNGISKKNEIIENLKSQITPLLYSKGAKFVTGIMKGFFKSALKIDLDYDKDDKSDGSVNINFDPISIFKSSNDKIKGNRILIFDDVERCKIPIDELYGYINDFVEHSECKVILISDEKKLDNITEKYSNFKYSVFKEKIIGQTFEIKPDTDLAVDFFINSVSTDIKNHLEELKGLIIHSFEVSEKENLRVLQRAIYDFERLFKFLNPELKTEEGNYKLLIKNYLGYFLIYFLEIKTGNEDISSFQQSLFLSKEEKAKKFSKYDEIIKNHSLEHSTKLFTPSKLVDYINNGNYVDLIDEINNSAIFTSKREEKNWEKLWYWKLLDDNEFSFLLKDVVDDFFKTDNFHITEILHISGILFSLIDEQLCTNKNKGQVVNRAKNIIKKLDLTGFKDNKGFSSLSWGSWQKGYASATTPEFKSILDYTKNILSINKKKKSKQRIEEIFYNITNDNIDDIYRKVRVYDENLENIIEQEPILSKLDYKKFAKIIFQLNNNSIFRLIEFIEYRYFPEKTYSNRRIESQQIAEKDFLIDLNTLITKEIKKKDNKNKPLRKYQLKELENIISKSISRL